MSTRSEFIREYAQKYDRRNFKPGQWLTCVRAACALVGHDRPTRQAVYSALRHKSRKKRGLLRAERMRGRVNTCKLQIRSAW